MDERLVTLFDEIRGYLKEICDKLGAIENKIDRAITVTERKERIAVFVDSQNLYYSVKAIYGGKVDYNKLLYKIRGDRILVKAISYVVHPPEGDVRPFVASLEKIGYEVRLKEIRIRGDGSAKANWDMGIALDILGILDKVDTVVLVSGDGDFVPLLSYIRDKGKTVEVYSFEASTAYDLRETADRYVPLDESVILDYR
ncbi:NYN domain-containing protein [candidate division WOR-3 bacterium]|uniref:NYN domain-containing protein n=1 Tax=candidate division WOR-3 bacterium TaxID=2052148 RepID=A0A660SNY2_UNCW3|nr:MAG: NYN domain-containing protein [candidate division WOR-3 bacterium]